MKMTPNTRPAALILPVLLTAIVWLAPSPAAAQPELVHLQGRLVDGTNLANGTVNLTLRLFASEADGTAVYTEAQAGVPVADGLFSTFLGQNGNPATLRAAIANPQLWLEYTVDGTRLVPRERIGSVVYALRAASVPDGAITSAKVAANSLTAADLAPNTFWSSTGNAGTDTSLHFLGTTDDRALSFQVNGIQALQIRPAEFTGGVLAPNLIGGVSNSSLAAGVTVGGGRENDIGISADFATVGGGRDNDIGNHADFVTVGGGFNNDIGIEANFATVGGGAGNVIGDGATFATITGGRENLAAGDYSFAAGRLAKATNDGAFVWADSTRTDFSSTGANQFLIRASGGVGINTSSPQGALHVNGDALISSNLNFGATTRQMVNLWKDEHAIGVQSLTTYFRSGFHFAWFRGGAHSDTQNDPGAGGTVLMTLTSGGLTVNGTFVSNSDRHAKQAFEPIDPAAVLDKVAALPLSRWTFKTEADEVRHLGPMAQDFHAAFGLGSTDTGIATVDADGVALAAIQGLNAKVEAENAGLRERVAEQDRRLAELEVLVRRLVGAGE